jgi:hypothetical protein
MVVWQSHERLGLPLHDINTVLFWSLIILGVIALLRYLARGVSHVSAHP